MRGDTVGDEIARNQRRRWNGCEGVSGKPARTLLDSGKVEMKRCL